MRAGVVPSPDGINQLRGDTASPLFILMGTVGFIMLLACINLSFLQLARAVAREREISIRLAIGAGRGRLIRQFLTESLVLAALGGVCGIVLANWLSVGLVRLFLGGGDFELPVGLDWRVNVRVYPLRGSLYCGRPCARTSGRSHATDARA